MKKAWLIFIAAALAPACSTHFHIDLLGTEELQEVVLRPSPAPAKILVLDIEGTIASFADAGTFSREGDVLSRIYARLERAAADPQVKAVILRLDTPGGEVTASDIIYREILRFKERTGVPVIGLMMSVAASGGYYVAQACDAVLAHPSTITGSIGVISVFPSVASLFDKIGVQMNIVKSGGMKDAGSPFRTMTDEERRSFQGMIDEYYENFLRIVLRGRKNALSEAELRPLADGRVFTATQALRFKLIDAVGYFDDAVAKALESAGLRAARIVGLTYFPKSKTNLYAAGMSLAQPPSAAAPLDKFLPTLRSGFYYLWLPNAGK